LRDYIRSQVGRGEAPSHQQADRYGRVEMAAGYVTDGISHGQNRQPKSASYSQKTDAGIGETGSQHRGPAASKNQPECSDKLRNCARSQRHDRVLLRQASPQLRQASLEIVYQGVGLVYQESGQGRPGTLQDKKAPRRGW
jgi:hypothetical protein